MNDHGQLVCTLSLPEFRRVAFERALRILDDLQTEEEIRANTEFKKLQPSPLLRTYSNEEYREEITARGAALLDAYPNLVGKPSRVRGGAVGKLDEIGTTLVNARSALEVLGAYHELLDLEEVAFGGVRDSAGGWKLTADRNEVHLWINAAEAETEEAARARRDTRVLAAAGQLHRTLRTQHRAATTEESAALDWADALLDRGVALTTPHQPLGATGFRRYQTSLSLADPGPGHLAVTCRADDLLAGTVVHVEHIDRDGVKDKEVVEAYRLPAARLAARVRLSVGDQAPVTAYIGRPIFENHRYDVARLVAGSDLKYAAEIAASKNFDLDLLKTAHMTASACSAMFRNGIADCKIAIERMSIRQAIRFMRAVAGNVIRDGSRQFLSAAFNINTPLIDDRNEKAISIETDRVKIGRLAIEIAKSGGFEKVTWDGASEVVPSVPITQILGHQTLVDFVHEAHSAGLETYISAGMKNHHIADAAISGVGGAGIGTSLHFADKKSNLMGALVPELIRSTLAHRNEAAKTAVGRAAKLLARVDRMWHEGSLLESDQNAREELYGAVRGNDPTRCEKALAALSDVAALRDDQQHPVLEAASRLLDQSKKGVTIRESRLGRAAFNDEAERLGRALRKRDVRALREIL